MGTRIGASAWCVVPAGGVWETLERLGLGLSERRRAWELES